MKHTTVNKFFAYFFIFFLSGGFIEAQQINPNQIKGKVANYIFVAAYAPVVCNGVVDDTAALNAAAAASGSMLNPPTFTFVGQTHNQRQNVVIFPSNGKCLVNQASAIEFAPGTFVEGNNATITQSNVNGGGIAFEYNFGGSGTYGYGTFFNGARNLNINGPGSGTSNGRGLFLKVASFGDFENITIQGFKFGVTAWEMQYTKFSHVYTSNNVVGKYITAQPSALTLTSIDNYFDDDMSDLNTKYGYWLQTLSSSQFDKVDASRNNAADIVIGSQLVNYLTAITITGAGTACPINSNIPLTITDGTGLYAQAYATSNGTGNLTQAYIVDAGRNYSATPTITAPSCTGATFTATRTDDTGLGDWNGIEATNRGSLIFNNVKTEHVYGVDGPISGYAVLINGGSGVGAMRDITFNGYQMQRQSGGNNAYYRLGYNEGFGNSFNWTGDSSGTYDAIANPVTGDFSIFRNVLSQGLTARWNNFQGSNVIKYTVDETSAVPYGGFRQSTMGFTGDGKVLGTGYHSSSSFASAAAEESDICNTTTGVCETNLRFQRDMDGTLHWGAGGATALDTATLKRTANNILTYAGTFNATVAYQLAGNTIIPTTVTGSHGNATGTKIQLSDNTGVSVPAAFDANGNLTATVPTGTGVPVLANTPTLITPVLGVASATSVTSGALTGTGTASFAVGAAAGTTPGTPTCVASHVCDSVSGTIALTMGTATTTGVLVTVTLSTTRTNQANCSGELYLAASPFTNIPIRMTETTTTAIFNAGTAPTASTAYEMTYICAGK